MTAAVANGQNLDVPCAFVVPLGDDAGENLTAGPVTQVVASRFGVVVCVSNTADERGQQGADDLEDIRDELIAGLCGWSPDDERYDRIFYQGSDDDPRVDRARIWHQFNFAAMEVIGGG